ncbi:MAG: hypothetical protein ABIV43_00190 [Candidatus Saccharimonadales bacterium]
MSEFYNQDQALFDSATNQKPNFAVPLTEAAEKNAAAKAPKQRAEKASRRISMAKRAGALAVAGLVAGSAYGAHRVTSWRDKVAGLNGTEVALLNTDAHKSTSRAANVVVLNSGVVYRNTPDMIDNNKYDLHAFGHHLISGNIAGKVPAGQEIVAAKPKLYVDKDNTTWMGFVFQDGQIEKRAVGVEAVGQDMVWVNASKMRPTDASIALNSSNSMIKFTVSDLVANSQPVSLDEHGQYLSEAGNPVAWAQKPHAAGTYAADHRADRA